MRFGYACINETLKPKVKVNRSIKRARFDREGLSIVSELVLKNIDDLLRIMVWNSQNGIKMYRMSSAMFPWLTEYDLEDLPDWDSIRSLMRIVGDIALEDDIRLTFHPGPFNVLCSPKHEVVRTTLFELEQHGKIMDYMGLSQSYYNSINIHVGGAYGNKQEAMDRWIQNYKRLSYSVRSRLTLENDDKPNMYSVEDLHKIYQETGVPIMFDFHHWDCHNGELTQREALELAMSTWPENQKVLTHYSSSRKDYEDEKARIVAHADWIYNQIPFQDLDFDVMFECKAKEKALLKYKKDYE